MQNITEQIELNYRLTFDSSFHMGTGLRTGLINRSAARDANGFVYIPGSTIKGVLRDLCEQLLNLFDSTAYGPHDEYQVIAEASSIPDTIGLIFGSRFYPGKVYFDDALMISEDKQIFDHNIASFRNKYRTWQTENRTQVSISRLTHAAKPNMLFTSEFGISGLSFDGRIYGYLSGIELTEGSPCTSSLLLLLMAMKSLDWIGGNKSSGAGKVTLTIQPEQGYKINGTNLSEQQINNIIEEQTDYMSIYLEELGKGL